MKNLYLLLLLTCAFGYCQDSAVINWVNANAVRIEDTNPNTQLIELKQKGTPFFNDVKIFGFGEATHFTKEFFDMKVKFFKYLVENEGVTVFLMEDLFYGSYAANEYIAGGDGDAKTVTGNLGFALWRNNEVLGLIEYMRVYNQGKPTKKQLKFYGIDCQYGYGTNDIIKKFIKTYGVKTRTDYSTVLDSCAGLQLYKKYGKILNSYLTQLDDLKADLTTNFKPADDTEAGAFADVLHTIDVLRQFAGFIKKPTQPYRDKCMADNVQWAMQLNGPVAKGFIWAHNGHVSKQDTKYKRLGMHLKDIYGRAYYSMGFNFAKGTLWGSKNVNKVPVGVEYTLTEPDKDTPEAVFNQADAAVFLIDFNEAAKNAAMNKFLKLSLRIMDTGASGFQPKWYGDKGKLTEMYDGLIFIRDVSISKYLPGRVRDIMINPTEKITITR